MRAPVGLVISRKRTPRARFPSPGTRVNANAAQSMNCYSQQHQKPYISLLPHSHGLFIILEPGYRRSGAVMTQAGRGTVMAWSGSPDWKGRLAVQHADMEGQTREQARQAREREEGRQEEYAQQRAAGAKTAEVERQI